METISLSSRFPLKSLQIHSLKSFSQSKHTLNEVHSLAIKEDHYDEQVKHSHRI